MPITYWLFVMGVLLVVTSIGYGTFATARLLQHWRPERNLLLHPGENLIRLAIILLCLGLGKLSGLSQEQLGWGFHQPARQLLEGTWIGLGLGFCFYYATRWVMQRTGQRFYSTVVIEHIAPTSRPELVLVLLALLPTVILEELLFRSLLLGGLAPIVPVPVLLIGLSIFFGLLHSPQGIWGMVGAGLAGFLFGAIFLWQGSLLTPIVAHYITNAFQMVQAMRFYGK